MPRTRWSWRIACTQSFSSAWSNFPERRQKAVPRSSLQPIRHSMVIGAAFETLCTRAGLLRPGANRQPPTLSTVLSNRARCVDITEDRSTVDRHWCSRRHRRRECSCSTLCSPHDRHGRHVSSPLVRESRSDVSIYIIYLFMHIYI